MSSVTNNSPVPAVTNYVRSFGLIDLNLPAQADDDVELSAISDTEVLSQPQRRASMQSRHSPSLPTEQERAKFCEWHEGSSSVEILKNTPNAYILQQFDDLANPKIHCGTISGVGCFLNDKNPNIKVIGTEPSESNILQRESLIHCGTISGVGCFLNDKNPNVKVIGTEPSESNILQGESLVDTRFKA
ncbi:hypothetical protein OPV22_010209 [Ensete ventricosum]|uniref:Uncharacterized protein n=1 Tax=Ensete ventricosum TaxID=4639 RepID=A0AAV8RF61_ENSVE|nr:hypothetical protein OPV22_010209 [Ensete ventricosum]